MTASLNDTRIVGPFLSWQTFMLSAVAGYLAFDAKYGIHGLGKIDWEVLRLLAVESDDCGKGNFKRFLEIGRAHV